MTTKILDWQIYQCAACKAPEIGGLLGELPDGKHCCPNCEAECTDLTVVDTYKIVITP